MTPPHLPQERVSHLDEESEYLRPEIFDLRCVQDDPVGGGHGADLGHVGAEAEVDHVRGEAVNVKESTVHSSWLIRHAYLRVKQVTLLAPGLGCTLC